MTAKKKQTGTKIDVPDAQIPSTVSARSAGAKEGQKQKDKYQKLKAFAIEREKDNYSKLFIIHEKGNWWKMLGHSAIIFNYEVSDWVGYRCKLLPDSDYENKSEEGVINIRDVFELDKKLVKTKISLLKSTEDYRVYNIGKKFTQGDLLHMQKKRDLEWSKVNKIILPKVLFPELYQLERDLFTKVYFMSKNLDTYAREIITNPIVKRVGGMLRDYSILANSNGLKKMKYIDRVKSDLQWCTSQMALVSELRMLPPEKIFQILSVIGKVKREAEICRPKLT